MSQSSPISSLGYLVFGAADLRRWEDFAASILGMQIGVRGPGSLGLRIDDHEQRFLLLEDGSDDLQAVGWEFDTEQELDAYAQRLEQAGIKLQVANAATTQQRRVEKIYSCEDPNGWRHEFHFGPSLVPLARRFSSPLVAGGFLAGRLGAGHLVAIAKNAAQTNHFYKEVLGLTVSDYIKGEVFPGGPVLDATFYHVATGRHHSIAIAEAPVPKRIDHMMVQVNDLDDVGLAFDRCMNAELPIRAGIGHHPNDRMTSFYVQTPSGFYCEYGYGGIVVDDATWEVVRYSQLSDWGHRPVSAPPI
nr:G491 [uncultured bacterium]